MNQFFQSIGSKKWYVLPLYILLSFCSLTSVRGQYFTSNSNGAWSATSTWTRTNPNSCVNQSTTPQTNTYWPDCQVDVLVKHEVTYSGNAEVGGGYFKSLTVDGPLANVKFSGDLRYNTAGSNLPAPNNVVINVTNGATLDASNGTLYMDRAGVLNITGNSTVVVRDLELVSNYATINIEAGSQLIVLNQTTINSPTTLDVKGDLQTGSLKFNSGGNLIASQSGNIEIIGDLSLGNGSLTLNDNSAIQIGGNATMSGGSQFNINQNGSVNLEGTFNLNNGNLNLSGYGDISVGGDFKFIDGGGGTINMSDDTYIHTEGNLHINQHTSNLSGNAIFTADGNTIGNSSNVQKTGNSCFNTQSEPSSSPCARVLPVVFEHISAQFLAISRSVRIDWGVTHEEQGDQYQVERSFDGIDNFIPIDKLSLPNQSEESAIYSTMDKSLPIKSGRLYYRIKQISDDGKVVYSKVTALDLPAMAIPTSTWKAYPNPARGQQVNFSLTNSEKYNGETILITVFNSMNQSRSISTFGVEGVNTCLKDILTDFSQGLVIVEFRWTGQTERIKLLL